MYSSQFNWRTSKLNTCVAKDIWGFALPSSHLVQCGYPELINLHSLTSEPPEPTHLNHLSSGCQTCHLVQQQWRSNYNPQTSSCFTKLVSCECWHCLVSLGGKNHLPVYSELPHQHYWSHNCEFPECTVPGVRATLTLWSSGLSSDRSISVLFVLHSQLRLTKYSSMEMVFRSRFMSFVILRERSDSWCSASCPLPLPPQGRVARHH